MFAAVIEPEGGTGYRSVCLLRRSQLALFRFDQRQVAVGRAGLVRRVRIDALRLTVTIGGSWPGACA